MATPDKMKVIIVGGSVAGLTLAHCLEKAGIEYILLEKRPEIAPQEGAFLAIMPNGARILHQLDILETIEPFGEPVVTSTVCFSNGSRLKTDIVDRINRRFGYPVAVMDRRVFLQALYDSLLGRSTSVRVNEEVIRIEQRGSQTRVLTANGTAYDGNIVVGADGVHSKVQDEIWRMLDAQKPGASSISEMPAAEAAAERREGRVKYICIFGVSAPQSGSFAGQHTMHVGDRWSIVTFTGVGGRIFWILSKERNPESDQGRPCSRLTTEQAVAICEAHGGVEISGGLQFADLWDCREHFTITALDEHISRRWSWGRVLCIGDSIHKMNPWIGQGANCAIEDAAILTNLLLGSLKKDGPKDSQLSDHDIDDVFHRFETMTRSRVSRICKAGMYVADIHAKDNLVTRFLWKNFTLFGQNALSHQLGKAITGSPVLDFLKAPEDRALQAQSCGFSWFYPVAFVGPVIVVCIFMLIA